MLSRHRISFKRGGIGEQYMVIYNWSGHGHIISKLYLVFDEPKTQDLLSEANVNQCGVPCSPFNMQITTGNVVVRSQKLTEYSEA